jgi:phosphate transport system substrate-binding protein
MGLLLVATCILMMGCGSSNSTSTDGGGGASIKLQGSGASFPDPLYQAWFKEYSQATSGVTVDYTATGSGAGITDLTNKLVDFAGSDAAMSDEEMAKVDVGVQLLPVTAGKIVLAYNLSDGPAELKLSREAYTGIFLGKITKWNDPAIVASNEGATMPDKDIHVVTRADSSGTTYVFTNHLAAVNPAFGESPGTGKTVDWPIDNMSRAPKNAGVTKQIKDMDGAIGYIEYGFAKLQNLAMASLENKAGKYIEPTLETGTAALANVTEMPENLRVWLPDPEGDDSYPCVTYTWLMCYKKYDSPEKAEAIKNLIKWCVNDGQAHSGKFGYIPLPENVVSLVTAALDNIQ